MANRDGSGTSETGISRVGILGLGLIGGSLAKALRAKAKVPYIAAVDIDGEAGRLAMEEGVIDAFSRPGQGYAIFEDCDLVLLCTPLAVIIEELPALGRLNVGILSDVGSVKEPVMESVSLPNFIGGHPMAGSERHGYVCSNVSLFENAIYVLCVGSNSTVSAVRLTALEKLIRSIGAIPVRMDAGEHDRRVAAISHLPHVAASALSLLAARLDDGDLAALAAGGFRDITRIASSDAALWAEITSASSGSLVPILSEYIDLLTEVRERLEAGDRRSTESFFAQAAHYRNSLPTGGRGALDATSSLTVYLEDKPGELGAITTLLGKEGINIRNINIRNFRTYEGGQLHLLLENSAQAVRTYSILKEAGYECD
ncbi:prephenate dehydrogenase/arogenate dehydrogenase family protein [Candidatus Saccharibacteria bacterium]|nr:prephenate dehydrogenase/arogenate dehydrogenase family protein [Candidatus Saccharibacteria bacterium]